MVVKNQSYNSRYRLLIAAICDKYLCDYQEAIECLRKYRENGPSTYADFCIGKTVSEVILAAYNYWVSQPARRRKLAKQLRKSV